MQIAILLYHLFLLSRITSPWPHIPSTYFLKNYITLSYVCLEREMATHSSTLAWKIPWTEEPGRLQSMGSQRVGHDWATSLSLSRLTKHTGNKGETWHFSERGLFFFFAISAATFLQDDVHNYEYLELEAHFKNQSFTLIDIPTLFAGWERKHHLWSGAARSFQELFSLGPFLHLLYSW